MALFIDKTSENFLGLIRIEFVFSVMTESPVESFRHIPTASGPEAFFFTWKSFSEFPDLQGILREIEQIASWNSQPWKWARSVCLNTVLSLTYLLDCYQTAKCLASQAYARYCRLQSVQMFAILNYYGFEMEKASSTARLSVSGQFKYGYSATLGSKVWENAPFKYTKQPEETHWTEITSF